MQHQTLHCFTWWAPVGSADAWIVPASEFLPSRPSTNTLRINSQRPRVSNTYVDRPSEQLLWARNEKRDSHLSLRSSIVPSSGLSHLSHRNLCTSDDASVFPSPVSLWTSTQAQCQARFGKLGRISKQSWIISSCPSAELDLTRTWHVCTEQVNRWNNRYRAVGAALAVAQWAVSWV